MAQRSLARRLFLLLAALTLAAWAAVGAYAYLHARHEAEELFDAHLAQAASLLLALEDDAFEEIDTEHAPRLHRYARKVAFQVWQGGRTLRLHSANAPNVRFSRREEGFSDALHGGERWRVFSAWDLRRRVLVQVGERREARDEVAGSFSSGLLTPLLAALPLLALAVWLAVRGGLAPLRALGAEVARRDPAQAHALEAARAPAEARPLVEALNGLFARVGRMLERERRFTADAAHELRTPLAAMRTQAQLAHTTRDAATRREALEAVVAGSVRTARLVDQLLTLARLEAGQTGEAARRCDLRALVRDALAEQAPEALARGQDIVLEDGAEATLAGHPGLLSILARNLVDNALRYAPEHGTIRVRVERAGAMARFEIENPGEPLASADLARLGERFHRAAGAEAGGSGLGLSIVARIAELHGGRACYEALDGGGLRVRVELPAQHATAA